MIPGVDIVSVMRIEKALSRFGEQFVSRILTPEEQSLYRNRKDSIQFLAGRFAAKEAIYKAAGIPNLTWQRVNVLPEGGKPVVRIDGHLRQNIQISISHEKEYAIALAICTISEKPEPDKSRREIL
ncbi:MAG: holo-[acyl-carrier-protein] synthase [Acidobacteria bacterium CG_4_9_14_3_um_filter_49_7]|nr:MAG: holo-[acyl-carrier-protein] synthase [Acidobacteria bacterium CG_4_9_14_3_um_filter_49_7]